jgi:hypothetical protein
LWVGDWGSAQSGTSTPGGGGGGINDCAKAGEAKRTAMNAHEPMRMQASPTATSAAGGTVPPNRTEGNV